MSNPNIFQDVHRFDGLWVHNIKSTVSIDDKITSFNSLIKNIEELKLENKSVEGIKLICNSCQQETNYDPANKVYADDILIEFYNLLQYLTLDNQKTFIYILAAQMDDMFNLGTCQSGRCSIIWQMYKSLYESL